MQVWGGSAVHGNAEVHLEAADDSGRLREARAEVRRDGGSGGDHQGADQEGGVHGAVRPAREEAAAHDSASDPRQPGESKPSLPRSRCYGMMWIGSQSK